MSRPRPVDLWSWTCSADIELAYQLSACAVQVLWVHLQSHLDLRLIARPTVHAPLWSQLQPRRCQVVTGVRYRVRYAVYRHRQPFCFLNRARVFAPANRRVTGSRHCCKPAEMSSGMLAPVQPGKRQFLHQPVCLLSERRARRCPCSASRLQTRRSSSQSASASSAAAPQPSKVSRDDGRSQQNGLRKICMSLTLLGAFAMWTVVTQRGGGMLAFASAAAGARLETRQIWLLMLSGTFEPHSLRILHTLPRGFCHDT
jgi:hypothetical protein